MGHGRASKASTSKVSKQAVKFDRAAGKARLKAIAQDAGKGAKIGMTMKELRHALGPGKKK